LEVVRAERMEPRMARCEFEQPETAPPDHKSKCCAPTCTILGMALPAMKPSSVHARLKGSAMCGPSWAGDARVAAREAAARPPQAAQCDARKGLAGLALATWQARLQLVVRALEKWQGSAVFAQQVKLHPIKAAEDQPIEPNRPIGQ
jgi:hypothetical protein